jgi:hypothetical protein
MARGQGFEPRFTGPEPAVLPLDDPRTLSRINAENYCPIKIILTYFIPSRNLKIHTKTLFLKEGLKK